MIVVGLTGSIAMGKSETARMFAAHGIPVFDSDASVHRLYEKEGAAVAAIEAIVPSAINDGAVDRNQLAETVRQNPGLLKAIESAVHPLVRQMQADFLEECQADGQPIAVLDIPLLFETGRDRDVDRVVVVSAPPEIQRERALKRPGMTGQKLDFILSKQMPDGEKRSKADFVVDTSSSLDNARRQVDAIVESLLKEAKPAP